MKAKSNNQSKKKQNCTFFLLLAQFVFLNSTLAYGNNDVYDLPFFEKESSSKLDFVVGVSVTNLPLEIVEEEFGHVPMAFLTVDFRFKEDDILFAEVSSNYLTNKLGCGYKKVFETNGLEFSLSSALSAWYGKADFGYFNASTLGFMNTTAAEIAFQMDYGKITLGGEINFQIKEYSNVGNVRLKSKESKLSGVSFKLQFEQPVLGKGLILGAKINYSQATYHSWIAFSNNQNWLPFPTFMAAVRL